MAGLVVSSHEQAEALLATGCGKHGLEADAVLDIIKKRKGGPTFATLPPELRFRVHKLLAEEAAVVSQSLAPFRAPHSRACATSCRIHRNHMNLCAVLEAAVLPFFTDNSHHGSRSAVSMHKTSASIHYLEKNPANVIFILYQTCIAGPSSNFR